MELPRVMMISLQKCGTHLLSGLTEKIGYQNTGWVVGTPPVFPKSEDRRIMCLVYSEEQVQEFEAGDETLWQEKLMVAYNCLFVAWGKRAGAPVGPRHGLTPTLLLDHYEDIDKVKMLRLGFESMPAQSCWIKHELSLDQCDGQFIRDWQETGCPKIIFNYRDPRDVLISFINYLTKQTRQQTFSAFAEYHVFHRILSNLPDMEQRLMHAILDPNFPAHRDFEQSLWLRRHPDVCCVSFEEMVGDRGGGSDQLRLEAVSRILKHVGSPLDPEDVSRDLFQTSAFTFNRGKTGVWREIFTDEHHRAFNHRFGHITQAYGYELYEP